MRDMIHPTYYTSLLLTHSHFSNSQMQYDAMCPYTKVCMSDRIHPKRWKRKEIGVRLPDDPICAALLSQLDEPLLCGRYVAVVSYSHTHTVGNTRHIRAHFSILRPCRRHRHHGNMS